MLCVLSFSREKERENEQHDPYALVEKGDLWNEFGEKDPGYFMVQPQTGSRTKTKNMCAVFTYYFIEIADRPVSYHVWFVFCCIFV